MTRLNFVEKLYQGRNCYSDHMSSDELALLHIHSKVESIIADLLTRNKVVFLTGNPGDGKTFIIKTLGESITACHAYMQADLNNVRDYNAVACALIECYTNEKPAIVAVNEYPFLHLLRSIKALSPIMYDEIQRVRRSVIAYSISGPLSGRVAVIDLNERNLLAPGYHHLDNLIDRLVHLLQEEPVYDETLKYNLAALSNSDIKRQVLTLFELAAAECEHFAVRDILGALAFILTAGVNENYQGHRYYSTLFEGSNELLRAIQQYDPIRLTVPELDERLWNGVITDGWRIALPEKYPKDYDDVAEAVDCFKEIKRRYFFENSQGKKLMALQPDEVSRSKELFIKLESQKKKTKEALILAMNKLFLPSSKDKSQLRIWTTHRYDMSIDAAVAVSSKAVSAAALDLLAPRLADWIEGLEYVPNHLIMKPKGAEEPRLVMDVDFLRTLLAVDSGYPVGLLAPQYEQAVTLFLRQLDNSGIAEQNEDGETILACRSQSFQRTVYIQDGKYGFGEDER